MLILTQAILFNGVVVKGERLHKGCLRPGIQHVFQPSRPTIFYGLLY